MNLLEDFKMSFLNFNFAMIYVIHKMLVLLENHLNYIKGVPSNVFQEHNRRLFIYLFIYLFI